MTNDYTKQSLLREVEFQKEALDFMAKWTSGLVLADSYQVVAELSKLPLPTVMLVFKTLHPQDRENLYYNTLAGNLYLFTSPVEMYEARFRELGYSYERMCASFEMGQQILKWLPEFFPELKKKW